MATPERSVTNVFVPGRAHDVLPGGEYALSASSVARVETASDYFHNHAEAFEEVSGVMLFEGGWAVAAGVPKLPEARREGRLMRELAVDGLGVPAEFTREGIKSTTTMTNCLEARKVFQGVARLLAVTQPSQAARFEFGLRKTLPGTEVSFLDAPGEDDPEIIAEEARLLKQSRIIYGLARGPRGLAVADRMAVLAGRLIGLKPGEKYTTNLASADK